MSSAILSVKRNGILFDWDVVHLSDRHQPTAIFEARKWPHRQVDVERDERADERHADREHGNGDRGVARALAINAKRESQILT
jgi:hypothetical protein